MSREIKFRAWDKEAKKMTVPFSFGDLLLEKDYDIYELVTKDDITIFYPGDGGYRSDIELMQFTGLLDRHGKEICEGDFLEDGMYVRWCEKQGGYECWLANEYCLACSGDMHWFEVVQDMTYEVIGNVYETPELLEAQS